MTRSRSNRFIIEVSALFIALMAWLVVVVGHSNAGAAQDAWLDLDQLTPPELGEDSFAARRARALLRAAEAAEINEEEPAATMDSQRLARDARLTWRRLALGLAHYAAARPPEDEAAAIAIVAAHTLMDGADELDALIASISLRAQSDPLDDAVWRLRAFIARGEEKEEAGEDVGESAGEAGKAGRIRARTAAELDLFVRRRLLPLLEAGLEINQAASPESGWITTGRNGGATLERLDELDQRIGRATGLPPSTIAAIRNLADLLRIGLHHRIFEPDIDAALDQAQVVRRGLESIAAAPWPPAPVRMRMLEAMAAMIDCRPVAPPGEICERGAQRIEITALILDDLNQLRAGRGDRYSLDVADIGAAVAQLDLGSDDTATDDQLNLLYAVTRAAVSWREAPELSPDRELRALERDLADAAFRNEMALVEAISGLSARGDWMSDPAFLSLRGRQATLAEQLALLRFVDRAPAKLAAGDRGLERDLAARLAALALELPGPHSHDSALTELRRFHEHTDRFLELPFEAAMRTQPQLIATLRDAGRLIEMTIKQSRSYWIETWARRPAEVERAIVRMASLERFLHAHAATIEFERSGTAGAPFAPLDRFAAWQLGADCSERARATLISERDRALPLVDQPGPELAAAMTEMERRAKLGRLMGLMLAEAGATTGAAPEDSAAPAGDESREAALAVLSQLVYPPPRDALWRSERGALALLCRYVRERANPHASMSEEDLRRLDGFIDATIDRLLAPR